MTVRKVSSSTLSLALLVQLGPIVAQAEPLSDGDVHAIIQQVSSTLTSQYPFENISALYARRLASGLESGQYDHLDAKTLGKAITRDLQDTHKDRHLQVFVSAKYFGEALEGLKPEITAEIAVRKLAEERSTDFGFTSVELDPKTSTAYVASSSEWFADQESFEMASHAMNMAALSENIILDLRANPGGAGEMGRFLASYFFKPGDEKFYLYGFQRDHAQDQQEWTYAFVPGRRAVESRLFILIDRNTGSACEGFAFALQKLGRATVVGEQSAGAGIAGSLVPLRDDMVIFLPSKMIVAPHTQAGWEGVGVTPDLPSDGADARTVAIQAIAKLRGKSPKP